jgi:hypothetical protein
MTHKIEEVNASEDEDEDDPTWDALDWAYMVKNGDDIICICSTRDEAEHIRKLLDTSPYKGA